MSIQAQIINLLLDLKEHQNLTYMFITHDLSVVKYTVSYTHLDVYKRQGEMDECLWKRMLLALRGAFREAASLCSKDTGFFPPGGEQIVNEL